MNRARMIWVKGKAVLAAGLGLSALGTTEAVHPDRRMLTSRRSHLVYR
jgi:hypothetical protein